MGRARPGGLLALMLLPSLATAQPVGWETTWRQPHIEVTYAADAAEPIHIGATFFRQQLPEMPAGNHAARQRTRRLEALLDEAVAKWPDVILSVNLDRLARARDQIEAIATPQRYAAMRRRGYDLERITDGWRETWGIAFVAQHIPQAERPARIAAATRPRLQGEQHRPKRRPRQRHPWRG